MCPQSGKSPYLHRVSSSSAGSKGVTTFLGSSHHGFASAGSVIGVSADATGVGIGA